MNKIKIVVTALICILCFSLVGCKKKKIDTTCTVVFEDYDGTILKTEEVTKYQAATAPETPKRDGYEFTGWSVNFSKVASDLIVVAQYKEAEIVEYRIALNPNGGKLSENNIYYTDYSKVVLPTPTKENFIFDGWYQKGVKIESISENKNYSLIAEWKGVEFSVRYELDGGKFEGEYPVTYEYSASTPLVPASKDGYDFIGWYKSSDFTGNAITNLYQEEGDVVLYARFEKAVVYNLNGGNWTYSTREEVVSDFLKDAMEWGGKTKTPDGTATGKNGTQYGFVNAFGTEIYGFFSSEKYGTKWTWLKNYIIDATDSPTAKSELKNGEEVYWRYSLGAFLFKENYTDYPRPQDFSIDAKANDFWDHLSSGSINKYIIEGNDPVKQPVRIYYIFDGWYDNPDFTGNAVTSVNSSITLYAKWVEEVPVESISIINKIDKLDRFEEYQLEWTLNPSNAAIKSVEFTSSNENIATVTDKGLITPHENGTVTITIKSLSPSKVTDTVTIEISSPDHFDISYETTSYTKKGESVKLNAEYIKRDESKAEISWKSLNPEIATVDDEGNVKGVSEGVATIRAYVSDDENAYVDFVVTVLPENLSKELQHIVDSHESNIFTRYDLGIGAGTPVYYANIFGSVSTQLFNYNYYWDTKHKDIVMEQGNYASDLDTNTYPVEFITVHYTAGMTEGSDGEATAIFFGSGKTDASAHFCTGNDGIWQCLDLNVRGFHAGDGTGTKFEWFDTGVEWNENDPMWPKCGISKNSMFTINGIETTIKVPYKEQRGSEGYVTDSKWLTDQGLAFKVVDGKYYMGTTWWCYSNVWEGRICSKGGNNNSIGIESAVDYGSDLWLTWQITARLVADLMIRYDLDITRVVGHHFFAAKDCPQPLLENNLEIWWEFIELVKTEYETMTEYKDVDYKFTVTSGQDVINEYGRVIEQPEESQVVTYEVELEDGSKVTLATAVQGIYTK